MTYLHCLQHSLFEHLFNLYYYTQTINVMPEEYSISIMECRYFNLIDFNLIISTKIQHHIYIVHYNFI